MSAFIVNDQTITGILQAASLRITKYVPLAYYWRGERYEITNHENEVGQKLVDENYRSVNWRYNEKEEPHKFQRKYIRLLEPVEILKLCNCYEYQACETEDWNSTEAWAIIDRIKDACITALPGYDDALWEYNEKFDQRIYGDTRVR